MKILFLTLKTFSATSGIEKVCRLAGKALYEYSKQSNEDFRMYSLYDERKIKTEPYLPLAVFNGFGRRKFSFVIKSLEQGRKSKVVVLSHMNLLPYGYFIKLLSPKTKIILIANSVEGLKPFFISRRRMLKKINLVITVNDFIREKIKTVFYLPEEKFRVLDNCIDPFLPLPPGESRRNECRSSYAIAENDLVLMTLNRLYSNEKSKGYDKVLIAVKKLQASFPNIKYLFVGKYEAEERIRLDNIILDLGIEDAVIFTDFVPDAVLADFYNMSDVYIMPGDKEGYGFHFINALYYGKPVIAGRSGGVSDSRYGDNLGTLTDLRSQEDITTTIQKVMSNPKAFMPDRKLVMEKFGYAVFKDKWKQVLDEVEG